MAIAAMFGEMRNATWLSAIAFIGLSASCVLEAKLEASLDAAELPQFETDCSDNIDNDGDTFVDCNDVDCGPAQGCPTGEEVNCGDSIDNDGDTFTDCDDGDCASDPLCAPRELNCTDGIDNDGDTFTDCDDSDCDGLDCLATTETSCDDDADNDGDMLVDCFDDDCDSDPACTDTVLSVFVTSRVYSAEFTGVGDNGAANATDRADAICAYHATEGGLAGAFVAWLASATRKPIDLISSDGVWQLTDGTPAFQMRSGPSASLDTTPQAAISLDQNGAAVIGRVWTGAQVGGIAGPDRCSEWSETSPGDSATTGNTQHADYRWVGATDVLSVSTSCDELLHLYCVEK